LGIFGESLITGVAGPENGHALYICIFACHSVRDINGHAKPQGRGNEAPGTIVVVEPAEGPWIAGNQMDIDRARVGMVDRKENEIGP
jgi:hypothetical protein